MHIDTVDSGGEFLSGMRTTAPKFTPGVMLFPAVKGGKGSAKEVTLANDTIIVSKSAPKDAVEKFFEFFTQPATLTTWAAGQFQTPPYTFDSSKMSITDPTLKALFAQINKFSADAGPDGAALFNDQAIDVNVYTQYIWQGSVGLMSGDVTPEKLCQQLETATVAAAAKLR